MNNQDSPKSSWKHISVPGALILGIILIIGIWLIFYCYLVFWRTDLSWADKGNLGNMFGAVNALFSGFAFLAVVIALILQFQEIRSTKDKLEFQNFERRFFQLLNTQEEIIRGIEKHQTIGGHDTVIKGRNWIGILCVNFKEGCINRNQNAEERDSIDKIIDKYDIFFKNHKSILGPYFRNKQTLIDYIDRSNYLSDVEKKSFVPLIRSQQSIHETVLLFYHCISNTGKAFKPLVEKYSLLKDISTEDLINSSDKSAYSEQAFEDS